MIIHSEITEDTIQADGQRHITEVHQAYTGEKINVHYTARPNVNAAQRMSTRRPQLNKDLTSRELREIVSNVESKYNNKVPLFATTAQVKDELNGYKAQYLSEIDILTAKIALLTEEVNK